MPSSRAVEGSRHGHRRLSASLTAVLVLAASLVASGATAPTAFAAGPFDAHGSVNQVYTFGHDAGDALELRDGGSSAIATGTADAQGAFLWGQWDTAPIPAGAGYEVRNVTDATAVGGLVVTDPTDHPVQSFYDAIDLGAAVPNGNLYTYIPTRDGTLLSASITFPKDGSPGPWPVLIDYSGYTPSRPPGPPQEAQMYPYAGYVTVGLNVRGTTCSGGAFNIFEPLQATDGYDAVEVFAAQSWSTGQVGLVGISYPGITQLFVGQTNPPHLEAITPLSTYADFYGGIGYPGGIINSGFFLEWLQSRDNESNPAAHWWVQDRIANGDTTCEQNQVLRRQSTKLIPQATPNRFSELRGAPLSPTNFVNKIKVPTFLVGQFQDEQTGGQWSTMVNHFDPTTTLKVQLTNGTHVEGMGPEHLPRLMEFLDFYVAERVPKIPGTLRVGIPPGLQQLFNDPTPSAPYAMPIDRFGCYIAPPRRPAFLPNCTGIVLPDPAQDDYAGALAAYEGEPKVHVSWENGNGPSPRTPGQPFSSYQGDYDSWPLPGVTATPYYFQPDGGLADTAPAVADAEARGSSSYAYDPASKNPKRTFTGSSDQMWAPLPAVDWKPLVEGKSLNFLSSPFTKKTAFAGWGSADLWIRSSEADTDLEVTLTEVRPDGKETYIQSGWLRASRRALAAGSDELLPKHSHLQIDAAPLPAGEFALARVEIYPFTHVIRPGSRLRINVEVPGGNQAFWQIDPMAFGHPVTNDIGHSIGRPSRIVLPVVPDNLVPSVSVALPACPGLRGQACRAYVPARVVTAVAAMVSGPDLAVTWAPPPGPAPDTYRITVNLTGETFAVAGSITTFTYPNATPDTPFSFRVAAVFGPSAAPDSDASLAAMIVGPVPTSTTTAPATTSTTTAASTSSTAVTPTTGPGQVNATGTLPATGSEIAPWLELAALLIVAGGALVGVSLRRRAR